MGQDTLNGVRFRLSPDVPWPNYWRQWVVNVWLDAEEKWSYWPTLEYALNKKGEEKDVFPEELPK